MPLLLLRVQSRAPALLVIIGQASVAELLIAEQVWTSAELSNAHSVNPLANSNLGMLVVANISAKGIGAPLPAHLIANTATALDRLLRKLGVDGMTLRFCYEAGPCGYGIQRRLSAQGHECVVVAPSLIPKRAGDRVKTDRRDAASLAKLHRAGELTAVWVPDARHEAMRDLVRA